MENKSAPTRRERYNAVGSSKSWTQRSDYLQKKGFTAPPPAYRRCCRCRRRYFVQLLCQQGRPTVRYYATPDRLDDFRCHAHRSAEPADTREHFITLLQTYRDFQYQNATILQALLSEILANTELRQRYYQQLLEPSIQALEKDLSKHSQMGQIRPVDIPATARVLTSIFIGLFFLDVLGDPMAHSNRNEVESAIIALGYEGLAPRLPVE